MEAERAKLTELHASEVNSLNTTIADLTTKMVGQQKKVDAAHKAT